MMSEYLVWQFVRYGAHGQTVCPRWQERDGAGFVHFIDDVGRRPGARWRLVRIDEGAGYSAANCHWVEAPVRKGVPRRIVVVEGRPMTLRQAAQANDVAYKLLCKRLARGWSIERAIRP